MPYILSSFLAHKELAGPVTSATDEFDERDAVIFGVATGDLKYWLALQYGINVVALTLESLTSFICERLYNGRYIK